MRNRTLLHVRKLDAFAAWAAAEGWQREDPKGTYERFRLRRGSVVLSFYARAETMRGGEPEHLTAYGDGLQLVKRWLEERARTAR